MLAAFSGGALGTLLAFAQGEVPAAAQDEVLAAGPPLSLSGRLLAQGHAVTPAEAVYFDADEQVTEQYVRLLVIVQELSRAAPTAEGWRPMMVAYLEALTRLDPDEAPVAPPDALRDIHTQSAAYRALLATAAAQWLAGIQADDPAWLLRGNDAYAAAERARLTWYQAIYEHYTGEAAPNSLPRD